MKLIDVVGQARANGVRRALVEADDATIARQMVASSAQLWRPA